jgi:hypothetical protein
VAVLAVLHEVERQRLARRERDRHGLPVALVVAPAEVAEELVVSVEQPVVEEDVAALAGLRVPVVRGVGRGRAVVTACGARACAERGGRVVAREVEVLVGLGVGGERLAKLRRRGDRLAGRRHAPAARVRGAPATASAKAASTLSGRKRSELSK